MTKVIAFSAIIMISFSFFYTNIQGIIVLGIGFILFGLWCISVYLEKILDELKKINGNL